MFAKFKVAMDNAVGYDYPLREFDTFQDATAFYNNHWFNLGFVVPKKRSSWKSNIKRDWLAPGKGLVSVFEEGEQDYPRQHWLFSTSSWWSRLVSSRSKTTLAGWICTATHSSRLSEGKPD
jgi:hypothetical protein